jgi:deoxyguanosine kinase
VSTEPLHLRHIAIEGVLGAGKTTLAMMLARKLRADIVLERFEENPFLAQFYQDPARYAFQAQIFFLLSRYKQQQQLAQMDLFHSCVITDYAFERDRIFATVTLSEGELRLYEQVANALGKHIQQPDLVVYLQSRVDKLWEQIQLRGRPMEQQISREYLDALNKEYNSFFFRFSAAPVLIVNAAEFDFENDPEQFSELVHEITRPRTAPIQYSQPARWGGSRRMIYELLLWIVIIYSVVRIVGWFRRPATSLRPTKTPAGTSIHEQPPKQSLPQAPIVDASFEDIE